MDPDHEASYHDLAAENKQLRASLAEQTHRAEMAGLECVGLRQSLALVKRERDDAQMHFKLRERDLDNARTALAAFQEYDGGECLWAEMKRQRDAAVASVRTAKSLPLCLDCQHQLHAALAAKEET